MKKFMPRPPNNSGGTPVPAMPQAVGFGKRSLWPYMPVGEAARRDPHIPDPVPGARMPPGDQRNASPPVPMVGRLHAGGGVGMTGQHAYLVYVKRLGSMVQRTLARNLIAATLDARWRVGGVGYPLDYGFGPGYHGDAATLVPDNPQIYLRNPGIKPIINMPSTYRYAPNMVQSNGPTLGDIGAGPNGL